MDRILRLGRIAIGQGKPLVLISGPCVIENRAQILRIAQGLKRITDRNRIPLIFKASYDKANRTSISSFRGPGLKKGLRILQEVKERFGIPVLSDVHSVAEIPLAAEVLDILQIPAFLCRQTDLLVAAGKTGKIINVKKGQFLAPWDIRHAVGKITSTGNHRILLTERGTSFGYNQLVSDFRSLSIMRALGYPVIYDASHSVQEPGGLGVASGGQREFIPLLSRCAVAAGCDGIFMEVHPQPDRALSDGPNAWPLSHLESLLKVLKAIDGIIKN